MRFSRSLFRIAKSDRGGSLVEFALIVPMMMVLITGMYSLGMALSYYMVLTNAASAGARAFAISPAVSVTSGKTTTTITDPCAYAVQTANQAAPIMSSSSITYTFTYTTTDGKSTTYTKNTCNNITTNVGDTVQLKASYPYNFLLYGFRPGSLNVQARSAELMQ